MKIKSIAAICKKSKTIYLYTKKEENYSTQYIGNGSAIYPMEGVPELDGQGIMTIFDIPEKQRDDWMVREEKEPKGINLEDIDFSEKMMETENVQIIQGGRTLKIMQSRKGILLIDTKYLTPVMDTAEVMEFYERVRPDGTSYIAVKAGFLLKAVIAPVDPGEELQEKMKKIAEGIQKRKEYEKYRFAGKIEKDEQQIQIIVDEETGEVLNQKWEK